MLLNRNTPIYVFCLACVFSALIVMTQLMAGKFGDHSGKALFWLSNMLLPQVAIVLTKCFEHDLDEEISKSGLAGFTALVIVYFGMLFHAFTWDFHLSQEGIDYLFETNFQSIYMFIDIFFGLLFYMALTSTFRAKSV